MAGTAGPLSRWLNGRDVHTLLTFGAGERAMQWYAANKAINK